MSATIAALRRLEKQKNKDPNDNNRFQAIWNKTYKYGSQFWRLTARWAWILTTSMVITLIPLSIEVLREEQTNEIIKELLSKGYTFNQIQGMGYHVPAQDNTLSSSS